MIKIDINVFISVTMDISVGSGAGLLLLLLNIASYFQLSLTDNRLNSNDNNAEAGMNQTWIFLTY